MASATASLVWSEGDLYAVDEAPDEVRTLMGSVLGLSPAVHVTPGVLLGTQVRILAIAATSLGYTGYDAAQVAAQLEELDEPSLVALVPAPDSHKAMPPGEAWSVRTETFLPPSQLGAAAEPDGLRLATSPFRRNHTNPAASVQLMDDTELWAGAVRRDDVDATLWLNLSEHVAGVDQHALLAVVDGALVTPSPEHGAVRTAWRQAMVIDSGATEVPLGLDDLFRADAVVCLTTWGDVVAVASLDGRLVGDAETSVGLVATLGDLVVQEDDR
ncbi:hypothetical protein BH10ACT3_BH10ACT3_12650 [soil metagenome]